MSPWLLLVLLYGLTEAAALTLEKMKQRIDSWLVSVAAGAGRLGSALSGGYFGGYTYASAAAAPPAYAATSFVSRRLQTVQISGGQLSTGLTSGSVSVGLAVGGVSAAGGDRMQLLGSTAAAAPGVSSAVSLGRRQDHSAASVISRAGPATAVGRSPLMVDIKQ